jgi:hypothetical protein
MKYITQTIENRKLPYEAAPRLEIYAHLVEEGFALTDSANSDYDNDNDLGDLGDLE